MMRAAILLAAAMTLPTAAGAQMRPGADPFGYQAVHNFGRCAVNRSPTAARSILAMDFQTEAYATALRRFVRGHGYCGGSSTLLKAGSLLFAGALAEELLEQQVRRDLAARLALKPAHPLVARSPLEMTAICTVHRAPVETAALLRTAVESTEEQRAVAALKPALGDCLTGATTLRANAPAVRSLVALAGWRLVQGQGS